MKTVYYKDDVSGARQSLENGGLVAVPTETVYGIAANGLNASAVAEIYEIKGRPAIKPLSLMIPGKEAIDRYSVRAPEQAYALAEKFWPGPLTIVLNADTSIPAIVLANGTTVGLRCPDHPLTLKLLKSLDFPLAAPSANPSGEESPKTAQKVAEYFDGKIEGIIDGGECSFGLESTIISMSSIPFRILRQGALPEEEIVKALVDNMLILGVTGGSGTGKSTILKILKEKGFEIIDCDSLYHSMLLTDSELIDEIGGVCPECIVEGKVERKILAEYAFSNNRRLETLNRITHARIRDKVSEIIGGLAMNGKELVAVEAAELISSGLAEICKAVLSVTSYNNKRIHRIMARDAISEEAAQKRINAQKPDEYYFAMSDYYIENNGSITELNTELNRILEEIGNGQYEK